eukprot:8603531-Alexandrium_andersonii.AAC.1
MQETSQITANLVAVSPVSGNLVNTAHTAFVDDLATRTIEDDSCVVEQHGHAISDSLDVALERALMAQNVQKGESLVRFMGAGAQSFTRRLAESQILGIHSEVRYLGPLFHWRGSMKPEIQKRIAATRAAYAAYRRFWCTNAHPKLRRLVFGAIVWGTLLSGLAAAVLTRSDVEALTTCI